MLATTFFAAIGTHKTSIEAFVTADTWLYRMAFLLTESTNLDKTYVAVCWLWITVETQSAITYVASLCQTKLVPKATLFTKPSLLLKCEFVFHKLVRTPRKVLQFLYFGRGESLRVRTQKLVHRPGFKINNIGCTGLSLATFFHLANHPFALSQK
jgi:hypothetical protein